MNKIKVVTKAGITSFLIKSQKGQKLSERESHILNHNELPGFLHLDINEKNGKFKLYYNVTGYQSLRDYLQKIITKKEFAALLDSILEMLTALDKLYFNRHYLCLDLKYVMINPTTQKLFFLYIPIQNMETANELREFLLGIIQFAQFDGNEDDSYIQDYIRILNSGINFSVFDLEQYIKSLQGEDTSKEVPGEKGCPHCKQIVKAGVHYCPYCGGKIHGNTGSTAGTRYNPGGDDCLKNDVTNDTAEKKSKSNLSRSKNTGETNFFGANNKQNNYHTTKLNEKDEKLRPCLVRVKTAEKVALNTQIFRIGADPEADLCIKDNHAVSWNHAEIRTRGKRFFLVDCSSTNGTYIEEQYIVPMDETEFFSGSRIRFADEYFDFVIE